MECERLANCGFVKKYSETKNLAVKGFISMYCRSEKQNECKRKEYMLAHHTAPSDNMMPNGRFITD